MAPKTKTTTPAPVAVPVTPVVTAVPVATASAKKGRSPAKAVPAPEPVVVAPPTPAPAATSAAPKKRATKAVETPAPVVAATPAVAAPKKRATKVAEATNAPASVILNAKPATTPAGETVTLTKTKRQAKPKDPNAPPRNSAYNDYMKKYLPIEKANAQAALAPGATLDHKQIFKLVASNWKNSPEYKASLASRPVAVKA